jgi:CHASE2 domain-containing sensor protein
MRNDILIGGVIAIISAALIIYLIETERSLLQFAIGFLLFIFPVTFISSFRSTVMAALLVFFSILVCYVIFMFELWDAVFGILLAALIGGTIYYYRVSRVSAFHSDDYTRAAASPQEKP